MSDVRTRKVGNATKYKVLFLGGSLHGVSKWINVLNLFPEYKAVFPKLKSLTVNYNKKELPLNEMERPYSVETYILNKSSFDDSYVYVEEDEYRRQQKKDQIRYHQQRIIKHRDEVLRLKREI